MYFTPTIFMAQLLAVMQVLMTLDMPLSTTMALPVTSKPIESTVENLAWQAWIELPPEQKQQVKSRKVTPKSIFTLPLRVECPQGHKQVDTKCIPIVIGSNDVLIDLNALGLLVGNTQADEMYDYDDMGEEMGNPLPYGSEMPLGDSEKSVEGITVEFKPPSKDEPLKFNIFENKFNIFHEEPLEDYSSISYEGVQSSEKEPNVVVTTPQPSNETAVAAANITAITDLVSEASNISENNFEIYVQREKNSSPSSGDSVAEESNTLTTLSDNGDFKIEAISIPASGFETQKPNKLSIIQNDSSVQLVTSIMDTETTTSTDDQDKPQENDLQTLLQTESFLPMLQQATATTLQDSESSSLTTASLQEQNERSSDALSLNVDEEEMTTLPNVMEQELEVKATKQEYTRSVTLNPLITDDNDSDGDVDDNGDNDLVKDTTLEAVTNDEPLETTTPIQLDDTTIIETSSSLSTTPSTKQELTELLLQQEQAQRDFEELQRMRKGQKDHQHVVSKKSKVEPVEVLATATAATTTTTANSLPAATKTQDDELIATTAATAVTPLLTVHNENDNNDRFYYQHFAKADSEAIQHASSITAPTTAAAAAAAATKAAEIETIPLTSEIDRAEELRLINELVKGIRPATTLTTIKTMQALSTTTTTTTTEKPTTSSTITTTTSKTTLPDSVQSSSSPASLSESSTVATKPTPATSQIWSKILPLLTTTTTTTQPPKRSSHESFKSSTESFSLSTPADDDANDVQTKESITSTRSNRNSKIIRINGFNSISTGKLLQSPSTATTTTTSTTTATTTITEDSTPSVSTTSSSSFANIESPTENNTYEPYWWLPVAWRLDKPTNSEKQPENEPEVKSEEQPLLLRFWSAYHAPKSS